MIPKAPPTTTAVTGHSPKKAAAVTTSATAAAAVVGTNWEPVRPKNEPSPPPAAWSYVRAGNAPPLPDGPPPLEVGPNESLCLSLLTYNNYNDDIEELWKTMGARKVPGTPGGWSIVSFELFDPEELKTFGNATINGMTENTVLIRSEQEDWFLGKMQKLPARSRSQLRGAPRLLELTPRPKTQPQPPPLPTAPPPATAKKAPPVIPTLSLIHI